MGLKVSALMVPPASREYKCLPSLTSHNIAVPSLPPEAQREPSGETVQVYTTPVWPTKFVRSLQLLKFQTLTSLSQPADTISGILADGENATLLTQSVCISSVIVYLHSASVFHNLIVLSRLPDTI